MRILIADDDPSSLLLLKCALNGWDGYEVLAARDGNEAWDILRSRERPPLAILDWMMPGFDGVELCRMVRRNAELRHLYMILVTSREGREPLLTGLRAGANDYLTKPFDPAELEARVRVATHVVQLQMQLCGRVKDLESALARVKRLEKLLPICMYCKKIRDEQNSWQQLESYISSHSDAEFSHGICAECYEKNCEPQFQNIDAPKASSR